RFIWLSSSPDCNDRRRHFGGCRLRPGGARIQRNNLPREHPLFSLDCSCRQWENIGAGRPTGRAGIHRTDHPRENPALLSPRLKRPTTSLLIEGSHRTAELGSTALTRLDHPALFSTAMCDISR
uniref:Uncharacterized protein n=1 Tax=Triticum urartu TaxID=4572 RepID=A0A8R7QSZ7_TRIUA